MPPHPPDPELLLQRATRVRALAASLLSADPAADDVAQDALVASLQHESTDEPLSRWLAAKVRSLASRMRRSRARRRWHERAAARRESLPSTADLVERAWLQRTLVEAVVALEEPYRTTILLRFFEGLPPREIAARLGVPVRTVQTRLARGLARLRARLERQLGAEPFALLAAPLAFAPWPPAPPPPAPSSSLPPVLATGGLLVSTQLKLAAGAAVVIVVGALALVSRRASSPTSPSALEVAPARELADVEPGSERVAGMDDVEPFGSHAREATSAGSAPRSKPSDVDPIDRERDLFGEVVDLAGRPVPGAAVAVCLQEERADASLRLDVPEPPVTARTETDDEGRFRLRLVPGRRYQLEVAHAHFATERRPDRYAGEHVRVALGPAASVHGRITQAPDGAAVDGARVVLTHRPAGFVQRPVRFESDADALGAWRLDGLPAGTFDVRVEAPGAPSFHGESLTLEPGQVVERDVVLPAGVRLAGHVVDARTGQPIEGAEVGHTWALRQAVRTDLEGAFELTLAWPDASWVLEVAARAPGYARSESRAFRLGEELPGDLRIALRPGLRAVGRVLDASGRPLLDALVEAFGRPFPGSTEPSAEPLGKVDHAAAHTGPDGRFVLEDLDPRYRHALCVRASGWGTLVLDFPDDEGERGEVDFNDVALYLPATLRGRVVDAEGAPLPQAFVWLEGGDAGRDARSAGSSPDVDVYTTTREVRVDDQGRFAVGDLGPGAYQVVARLTGLVPPPPTRLVLRQGEQREGLELRVETGLSIEGRVVGPDGVGVHGAVVGASPAGEPLAGGPGMNTLGDGSFHLVGLAEGLHDLEVTLWPSARDELCPTRFEGIAAGSRGLVLELPRKATIRGRILGPDGRAAEHGVVQIDYGEGVFGGPLSANADASGAFVLDVPAGSVVDLVAFDWVAGGQARARAVRAGSEGVELRLAP